mmetsp:Transcript_30544/g.48999  ORF Transcript_30544/g.48999 Transcript_30544/m.48999 type:complete len:200 (+) Transcript_30544:486-1085(+)
MAEQTVAACHGGIWPHRVAISVHIRPQVYSESIVLSRETSLHILDVWELVDPAPCHRLVRNDGRRRREKASGWLEDVVLCTPEKDEMHNAALDRPFKKPVVGHHWESLVAARLQLGEDAPHRLHGLQDHQAASHDVLDFQPDHVVLGLLSQDGHMLELDNVQVINAAIKIVPSPLRNHDCGEYGQAKTPNAGGLDDYHC